MRARTTAPPRGAGQRPGGGFSRRRQNRPPLALLAAPRGGGLLTLRVRGAWPAGLAETPAAPPMPGRRPPVRADLVPVARRLRRYATFPERLLWSRLRRQALGVPVRRQTPIGPFVVDFYVPAARLVVEVDGRSHAGRLADDARRDAALRAMGLRVLRVTNDEVLADVDAVASRIRAALAPF